MRGQKQAAERGGRIGWQKTQFRRWFGRIEYRVPQRLKQPVNTSETVKNLDSGVMLSAPKSSPQPHAEP